MKYIIRRALSAVVTIPVVLAVYAVIYIGAGVLASTNTMSSVSFADNAWAISIAWVLVVAFSKQIIDWVKQVVA